MMKKWLAFTLVIAHMLFLFGCSGSGATNEQTNTSATTEITTSVTSDTTTVDSTTTPTVGSSTTESATTTNTVGECTHTWGQWLVKMPATCEKDGRSERNCITCHASESKEIPSLNHKESEWIIHQAASVGKEGLKYTQCVYCNQRMKEQIVPAIAEDHTHSGAEWMIVQAPSCTVGGSENHVCSCGKIMDTKAIPPVGHIYESTVVAPSPSTSGYTLHTCGNCGDSYKDAYTEFEPIEAFTYKSNGDGTCTVTGVTDTSLQYAIIPQISPTGDVVVAIGNMAFKNSTSIIYVEIPDTVTSIGSEAFYYCENLKTVIFPKTGDQTFKLNYYSFAFSGIEKADLSQTYMTTVNRNAFYGCKSLKTVTLNGVKTIEQFAFTGCEVLESLIHTGELTKIGERAFEKCTALTSVDLSTLRNTGKEAFKVQ